MFVFVPSTTTKEQIKVYINFNTQFSHNQPNKFTRPTMFMPRPIQLTNICGLLLTIKLQVKKQLHPAIARHTVKISCPGTKLIT